MTGDNDLSLEKLRIHQRLEDIEAYIRDGKILRSQINDTMQAIGTRTKNMELMIHGDASSHDKYTRDGMNRRLDDLEAINSNSVKAKESLLRIAVGATTIAVGGMVIWVFNIVKEAFIKGR